MNSNPDLAGWITKDELRRGLEAAGVHIPDRRLERLGNEGLLRPRPHQQSDPRVGSVVWYPPTAIDQIKEAVGIRPRRFKHVGWELWWRGYEVDEKWWRPEFDAAARNATNALRLLTPFFDPPDDQDFGDVDALRDAAAASPLAHPYWGRMFGPLAAAEQSAGMRTIVEVALGNFTSFEEDDGPIGATEEVGARLIGAEAGGRHSIFGKRLKLRESLGPVFGALSDRSNSGTIEDRYRRLSPSEIRTAANEVRQAMNVARNMHEAFRWIYGPNALGLGLARWLADHGPRQSKALWVIGWAELRDEPRMFLSSEEIAELELRSAALLDLSNKLQDLSETRKFKNIITAQRIKHAFLSYDNQSDFRKELAKIARSN